MGPDHPLKAHLGDKFRRLVSRLQAAVDARYALPAWDPAAYRRHKNADRLAAESEVFHVGGWSRTAMRDDLQIELVPLGRDEDPLQLEPGFEPWEPWPAALAAGRLLEQLQAILPAAAPAARKPIEAAP